MCMRKVRLQNCEKATISFVFSVCLPIRKSACNNSVSTARIFMKFDISVFFQNMSSKFKFHYNLTILKSAVHESLRKLR